METSPLLAATRLTQVLDTGISLQKDFSKIMYFSGIPTCFINFLTPQHE